MSNCFTIYFKCQIYTELLRKKVKNIYFFSFHKYRSEDGKRCQVSLSFFFFFLNRKKLLKSCTVISPSFLESKQTTDVGQKQMCKKTFQWYTDTSSPADVTQKAHVDLSNFWSYARALLAACSLHPRT